MSVHMFRCFIGRGPMSLTDLETRINDWVASNDEWEGDPTPHTLRETNTEIDGTGVTYHIVNVRFHLTFGKDNLLQKFTDKLVNKVDWYRVGYHDCSHDEDSPIGCSWDDSEEWTSGVSIPVGVPTFDVVATDGGVDRRSVLKAGVTLGAASSLLTSASRPARAATQTFDTAAHHDAAIAEKGVHHEQPANTDWAAADIVEKGYPSTDEGDSSLVSYYPLDEDSGSTANDIAGTNDGTVSGATVGQTGILGTTCYSFDGTDDRVALPAFGTFSAVTVSAWAKHDTPSDSDRDRLVSIENDNRILFGDLGDGTFRFFQHDGSTKHSFTTAVSSGTWTHWAMTWDGSTFVGYKDGQQVGSEASNSMQVLNSGNSIGSNGAATSTYFDGSVDELRIYSRALTSTQIQRLYEAAL